MLEHFSRRLQPMILSVRLPTALASAPTLNPSVWYLFPLLMNIFLGEMPPSAVPRSSGTLASLARESNKLLQSVITRVGAPSTIRQAKPLLRLSTSLNMARVYSARSRASRQALALAPKVDRMVRFDALLFQVIKDIGMASLLSRSS